MKFEYRRMLLWVSVWLVVLEMIALLKSELWLPGLSERVLYVLVPVSLVTAFLYVPWKNIAKKYKKVKKVQRVAESPRVLLNVIFQIVLVAYLVVLLLQEYVSFEFNSNYVMIFVIVFGIATVLFPPKTVEKEIKRSRWDTFLIYFLGVMALVLIFIKTKDLGWLSYLISAIAGILVVLLGYVVFDDDETKEKPVYLPLSFRKWPYIIAGLVVVSLLIGMFISWQAFRIVFGSVYALFLPGYLLSYVFFETKDIDALERIALSFALSISVVPLFVFYLNLIGMKINLVSVSVVILVICVLAYGSYKKKDAIKKIFNRKKPKRSRKK